MSLPAYILRRLLHAIPLLLAVAVMNFMLIALAPGDPLTALVGDFPAPPEYVAKVRVDYGLDKPMPVRLVRYLGHLAEGDFGYSFANRMPVSTLVWERLGATLRLTGTALGSAALLGVLLGLLAAKRAGGWVDRAVRMGSTAAYALPEFWVGQLLILLFAVHLGWLPSQGDAPLRGAASGWAGVLEGARYLLLPAFALALRYIALIARITRARAVEVLRAEFVLAARARGASETRIMLDHVLRNAAPAIITVIGYNAGFLLAGSALIETVFGWPGVGRLLFDSIAARDTPTMLAILLMVSATVVLANLLTDVVHRLLDRRVH
jgi:peptide/nickel transport system permease protein